jgi:hypothetical protein
LQAVQDGIARGDTAAHGRPLALIRQIGEKFLPPIPSVWSNPQKGQAVVIYLLSGGAPQIVRKLPRDRLSVDDGCSTARWPMSRAARTKPGRCSKTSSRARFRRA